jgi:hypothetical protein
MPVNTYFIAYLDKEIQIIENSFQLSIIFAA